MCWTGNSVKYVEAKRMTLWQEWMLKVVIRRTRHPDTLHDVSGALVAWNSKRDDLVKPLMGKAIVAGCTGSLSRITESPIIACQPPSDLHAWSEVGFEGWH
jgi:hypothetical protein